MKKTLCFFLFIILSLSYTGCSINDNANNNTEQTTPPEPTTETIILSVDESFELDSRDATLSFSDADGKRITKKVSAYSKITFKKYEGEYGKWIGKFCYRNTCTEQQKMYDTYVYKTYDTTNLYYVYIDGKNGSVLDSHSLIQVTRDINTSENIEN